MELNYGLGRKKKKTRMEVQIYFSRVLSRKAKWLFLFIGLGTGVISFDTRAEDANIDASFNQFDGYEVKFDYENYHKERKIAYEYYLDEASQYMPGITKEEIGIDLYDIDDDGALELLVYVNGQEKCPAAGCPFATLRLKTDGEKNYQIIPWSLEKGGHFAITLFAKVKVLGRRSLNFHDFLFYEDKKYNSVWRWNGKYYN